MELCLLVVHNTQSIDTITFRIFNFSVVHLKIKLVPTYLFELG